MIKTRKIARSSITGKFVSMQYALQNPDTTVVETIKVAIKVKKITSTH